MHLDEYRSYDATGLADLVARKEVSPLELLELAIASIEQNKALNAVVYEMYGEARRQIDAGLAEGPFGGVPFLLKDMLAAYAGVPMTSGCRFFGNFTPREHSGLVKQFLNAGLVVLGKTSTSELGLLPVTEPPRFGAARNPWDLRRTTGGSSGGSAAAVCAGITPMASGGDGGGSIRIPASCCGVLGLKPTRGRSPTSPYVEGWEGFAQEHVLTRSVRDSAGMLDVTNVHEAGAPYFTPAPSRPFVWMLDDAPRKLRIAYSAAPVLARSTHADCQSAVEGAVELLRELGHEVVEAAPTVDRREFIRSWVLMMAGQIAADVRQAERDVGRRATYAEFHSFTWLSRLLGEALPAAAYVEASRALKQHGRRFALFLEDYDAWLTPTLGQPPLVHGALNTTGLLSIGESIVKRANAKNILLWSGKAIDAAEPVFDFVSYTPLANAGGQPSISVPLHWSRAGLPIGVMFTARFGEDATLLQLARQLEEARPWASQKPPLPD
jgi:amidase